MIGFHAGYISGQFDDDSRADWDDLSPRPISWSCWYPVEMNTETAEIEFGGTPDSLLFTQGRLAADAKLSSAQDDWPLILLSHGTGGSSAGMAWLGSPDFDSSRLK